MVRLIVAVDKHSVETFGEGDRGPDTCLGWKEASRSDSGQLRCVSLTKSMDGRSDQGRVGLEQGRNAGGYAHSAAVKARVHLSGASEYKVMGKNQR